MGKKRLKSASSWKVAYADFVTAMMAFFLLMWILNMVPPDKKRIISGYFTNTEIYDANVVSDMANNPFVQAPGKLDNRRLKASEEQNSRLAVALKLKRMLMEDPKLQSASGISADDVGVMLRVQNDVMFKPGSAVLTPEACKALDGVLAILREYNLYLVVRGHTDDSEIVSQLYPSNWELSGARSAAAVRYLLHTGEILPSRLRSSAYADTRPAVPNTSPENRARNKRIEFFFHRPEVMANQVNY